MGAVDDSHVTFYRVLHESFFGDPFGQIKGTI